MRRVVWAALLLALVSGPALAVGGYGVVETIGVGADSINVLYVGGTPYEIGYWHGYLLSAQCKHNRDTMLASAYTELDRATLLAMWAMMEPYVSDELKQEMQGLADGSGIPMEDVYVMHTIPDASEFHCSAFNAFGPATANGHMLQMRILDWSIDTGIQDNPLIIVADPVGGHRYANISFCGFIGSIAGMSTAGIGVSEMGDDFDYNNETLSGIPMPFLLRNVIAHATSLEEAIQMMQSAHRTSSLWYVVGDAEAQDARTFQTSPVMFNTWGPGEMPDPYEPLANVCYIGHYMDRLYPDLRDNLGNLTPEIAIAITRHNAMSSNLLDAVYDLTSSEIWVAYAEGLEAASKRTFTYLDVKAFQSPPYVLATSPADGATGVEGDGAVRATFSRPMQAATINTDTFRVSGLHSGALAGTVSYDADTHRATFLASNGMPEDSYTATILAGVTGVKSAEGKSMLQTYTWRFTVPHDTAPPLVSSLCPESGCTVRGVVNITLSASDASGIDRAEIFVDGVNIAVDRLAPYGVQWDTHPLSVGDGRHTILVWVYDKAGNRTQQTIELTVDNTCFDDVPKWSRYWSFIEAVAREGIVVGCSTVPPLYCPDTGVTRGQMAVYLVRATGLAPYQKPTPTFLDVSKMDSRYPYVEAVYQAGITVGCNASPPLYCPGQAVSRAQMMVFLCRAAHLAPYDNPTPTFEDVPRSHPQYRYIEALHRAGAAGGCSSTPRLFCPSRLATRAEMAAFICRTFGITLH